MSSNVGNVGNIGGNNTQASQNNKRPDKIKVKAGENLTTIAQRFGMSRSDFVRWTGLRGVIRVGQTINLPTAAVPKSKGIYALAREYNMPMAEFAKMNGISDPQTYQAKEGEVFYVKPKTTAVPKKRTQSSQQTKQAEENIAAGGAVIGAAVGKVVANQQRWGSSYTPQELAEKLYELADDYSGAVGRPDFDALINQINPKNVAEVLEAYKKLEKNEDKDSLIFTITHEVRSKQQTRKDAVMKVYDALAQAKNAPKEKREEFKKELDDQFDSWGMVNTKKMDEIIDELIKMPSAVSASGRAGQVSRRGTRADGKTIVTKPKNGAGKSFTTTDLQKGAIASAKAEAIQKFKQYCKDNGIRYSADLLDMSPMERIPAPVTKGQSIVSSDSGLLPPTGKPNGKVIILNPGHGGYSSRSGYFDPGSYSFIKKGNGKYAPLLEYDKMQIYADSTVEKLRAAGYSVVLTNFHAETLSDQSTVSHIVRDLNNGSKGQSFAKKDIMFISLHADSQPGCKGSGVCYDPKFADDVRLAKTMQANLNEAPWVKAELSERDWTVPKKGLQVLHQTEDIPSVLLEVEYVNGSRAQNLDSSAYQQQFEDKMIEGINEYFGIK